MEHSIYLEGIKRAFRNQGVTYSALSKELRMTESGVKKMLNAKDISFRRVLQICDVLNILPGQLFSLSEKSSIEEVHLSDHQQEVLLKNRTLLAVYWRLAIEHCSTDEIEALQKLSRSELKRHLDRLVSLDLLSVRKGVYKAKHLGKFKWPDDSKIAKALNKEWSELVLQRTLQNKNSPETLHRLIAMKLSAKSYQEFLRRLSNLVDETIQESEREELTLAKSQLFNITSLLAISPKGFFDS